MTALDDALNSSAPLLTPATVQADWAELPEGMSVGGADSLRDLGQQIGPQGFEVNHSLDDGMPDAVTMTGQNDASGSFAMDLVGRPANIADILTGWRAGTTNGSGSGTSITVTLPGDVVGQDYVLVAIMASNNSGVYENNFEEGDPHGWQLLAQATDSTFTTYVFGRRHWIASPAPDFRIRTSGSWSWCVGTIGAHYTAGNSSIVPVAPGVVTSAIETVTQTGHTGPYAALPSRGYLLAVFATANASGPWTVASGGTQLVQSTGGVGAVQMVKANLTTITGDYRFVSNTAGSTGVGMMFNIPLVIMDREAMDAMAYFSQFESQSPVYEFERDTARVGAYVNVVSPVGVIATQVFEGQMADITLNGRLAQMQAVSQTRLDLDKALTLPTVYGNRENCTTDWLASWIMAHGGQYPGVAPSPQTRYWANAHGSVHANMVGGNGYSSSLVWDTGLSPTGPYGKRPPWVVDGPFFQGMFAQSKNDHVESLVFTADSKNWPTEVPGMVADRHDICSARNSVGRLTFWIRGDANDVAPAALAGGTDLLFRAAFNVEYTASDINFIACRINTSRQPELFLEDGLTLTGGNLPVDGLWHFVGFTWNYDTGVGHVRVDNVTWNLSGYTSASHAMATTEDVIFDAGRKIIFSAYSRLPIAELQYEAGPDLFTEQFGRFYPWPAAPSQNALFRPSRQAIEAVAEPTPVQGWAVLQELAECTLSTLRTNETDNVEMAALDYYGETAQLTVDPINVVSTDINAGELAVSNDPSKIRNYVTVKFPETRVDTNRAPVLDISSVLTIPGGVTDMTFALEQPAAELHGAAVPYTGGWNIVKLTGLEIIGSSPLPNEHFMSVNTSIDGTGSVYVGTGMTGTITGWSSSTVDVRFSNTSGDTKYIVNTGESIPFLRILGYPIRQSEAYESFRDSKSVARRRERSMNVEASWIQHRQVAQEYVGKIVVSTSLPRAEVGVVVMGHPLRKPGQLVQLADAEGTRAAGTWRILSVKHKGNMPQYTQELQLVGVDPVCYWDEGLWDQSVWGE